MRYIYLFIYLSSVRRIHAIQSYIALLYSLKLFWFFMAYSAIRCPIDMVSRRAGWGQLMIWSMYVTCLLKKINEKGPPMFTNKNGIQQAIYFLPIIHLWLREWIPLCVKPYFDIFSYCYIDYEIQIMTVSVVMCYHKISLLNLLL